MKNQNFRNFVENLSPDKIWESLPLVHTTVMKHFESIIDTKELMPTRCNILDRDLLYFFYGKPNYRNQNGSVHSTKIIWFPICILFNINILSENKIAHIFPFDSGAYSSGRYSNIIEGNSDLISYSLPNSLKEVGKFLSYFFENVIDYFNGDPIKKQIDPFPSQIFDCNNLYNANGDQSFDDRAKSIEISLLKKVILSPNFIDLVICPRSLRNIMDKAFGDEILIKYYNVKKLANAQDYYSVIDHIAFEYIDNKYMREPNDTK